MKQDKINAECLAKMGEDLRSQGDHEAANDIARASVCFSILLGLAGEM